METKSFWASKINWTQLVATAAMVAAFFGLNVPPELQAAIVTAIGAISAAVTIVWRTFFTDKAIL